MSWGDDPRGQYKQFRHYNDSLNREINQRADEERRHREHMQALNFSQESVNQVRRPHRSASRRNLGLPLMMAAIGFAGLMLSPYLLSNEGETVEVVAFKDAETPQGVGVEELSMAPSQPSGVPTDGNVDIPESGLRITQDLPSDPTAMPIEETGAPASAFSPPIDFAPAETREALATGKSVIWNDGEKSGYVLVSGVQSAGGQSCRNVSYTRFEAEGQIQSEDVLWCQTTSMAWVPSSR